MKPITLSRRKMLLIGGAAVAVTAGGGWMLTAGSTMAARDLTRQPLPIPPEDKGQVDGDVRVFDLKVQSGVSEFFEGLSTDTLGINGAYLGPVLRMRGGETVRLNVTNTLKEKTTIHWHGFNLPAKDDGGPHQEIEPGATWSPEFPILDKAATMWFHSHLFHKTAEQVWAGLAGVVFIDDDESDGLDLPRSYGVDDIPVVLQDREFQRNGQMPYNPGMRGRMSGYTGNFPLVNGSIAPYFEATTELVRLRLLNGANGSIYNLSFSDGREFVQIASDGGLLAAPAKMTQLLLAPGERADIVVDMSSGQSTTLRSLGRRFGGMMAGGSPEFELLELRVATKLTPSPALPTSLASLPAPDPSQATNQRGFELQMSGMATSGSGFEINGKAMDLNRIDEVVKKGETEIWTITNSSPMPHPLHIHNTQFRIIDRDGRAPNPGEAGLKDTVLVNPKEVVRLLMRFDNYTDAERPYMFHCHILEHEDAGMMGQFTVV